MLLVISFGLFGFRAEAQQIQEVYSYMDQNEIKASDHFSDLLYASLGRIEIEDGVIPANVSGLPKTLFIKMSDIGLLKSALQKYPSVEFVQIDISSDQNGKINLVDLDSSSQVKYILFFSTESIIPSSLSNSFEGTITDLPIVLLYQISRPG